ncbi:DUF4258 domain-containing protein [Pseudomonas sp. UBA4194]|jgi:hypothetical protein|uniref:DUF4258 domain-containing protein n=1 Tax=Pseudomonas sp. UBA4194 TaxID=1947317 RepID=UPI0039C9D4A2
MTPILPFPLLPHKALEIVRSLSTRSERVFYTQHARSRMVERGITVPCVMGCLAKGRIVEGPMLNPGGDWKVTMSWFRAGSPIQVVAALDIDQDGTFIVVVTTILRKGTP